jgi:hypothetical protein
MRIRFTPVPCVLLALAFAVSPAFAQSAVPPKAAAPVKVAKPAPKPTRAPAGALTFDAMDRNADGRLGEEEFRNAAAFVFAGSDRDNDGRVTRAEAERTGSGAVRTFEAIDTAKAGVLELPDFVDFCMQVFRAADGDHDGVVTVAERDAFRVQVKAAAGQRRP